MKAYEEGNRPGKEGEGGRHSIFSRIGCSVTLNESSCVVGQINLNHLTWQRRSGELIRVIIALQLL